MMRKVPSWVLFVVAGSLGAPLIAGAQDTPPAAQTAAPEKTAAKPETKKARKTWTDDDVASLRSPADIYLAEKEAQAAEAARLAKQQAAAAKQAVPVKASKPVGGPPALSNPKATADADKMIEWEDRDIQAQQEYVDNLRQQVDAAPADQKERLQQMLDEKLKTLEETRKERGALQDKKKDLEKQPPPGANPATPPPAQ